MNKLIASINRKGATVRRTHRIDSALLVLRVVIGVTMFMHGWQK